MLSAGALWAADIQIRENGPVGQMPGGVRISRMGMSGVDAGELPTAEKRTMPLADHFSLMVLAPVSQMRADMKNGVLLDLDMPTIGALTMADACAALSLRPPGMTLPFDAAHPVLSLKYNAAAKKLEILFNGSPISATALELQPDRVTRLCLRQRDQLALFAITPDGSTCTLVWCGRVDYRIRLGDAERYRLCRDVSVKMGERVLKLQELSEGLTVDALDELGDIVVSGTSPLGRPFEHRYQADTAKLEQAAGQSLELFRQSLLQPAAKGEGKP